MVAGTRLRILAHLSKYYGNFDDKWNIPREQSLPGIAEALFATALGLLAAIPAVVAYNKFNTDSKKYSQKLENFSKRFLTII